MLTCCCCYFVCVCVRKTPTKKQAPNKHLSLVASIVNIVQPTCSSNAKRELTNNVNLNHDLVNDTCMSISSQLFMLSGIWRHLCSLTLIRIGEPFFQTIICQFTTSVREVELDNCLKCNYICCERRSYFESFAFIEHFRQNGSVGGAFLTRSLPFSIVGTLSSENFGRFECFWE